MAHRIVIVGAGYAGLAAATRLGRRTAGRDVQVELVNAGDSFVERVRLHQVAAGTGRAGRPLAGILTGTGVGLRLGTVAALDTPGHEVVLDDGRRIEYDTLVYALGSRARRVGVPGVAEFAYTADSAAAPTGSHGPTDRPVRDVSRLATALRTARTLVVCGGGLTGVEAATELAEAYPRVAVTLVSRGEIGYSVSDRGRDHIHRVLRRLGVRMLPGRSVTRVTADAVELDDGSELPADVTLWCGSFEVPAIAAEAGLATDATGRVLVDATMRSASRPDVYTVGDAAAVPMPWGTPRMSCQAGLPAGLYAADAIADRLAGREPPSYRFRFSDQCISLGRHDGLIQPVRTDDSPHRTVLTGRTAAVLKEYICRGAAWAARTGRLPHRLLYGPLLPGSVSADGNGREWSTTSRETARVSTT